MNVLDGLGIDSAKEAESSRLAKEDEVGQNDFLRMLVAQLENQDPLNPQDSAAFASQLAQFSMVEQMIAVRAGIDQLVANSGLEEGAGGGGASQLDPAALVGREVVVFGSQIEVDAERNPIVMPLRTIDTATRAEVRIFDPNGVEQHRQSVLPFDSAGNPIALRAGDHEFNFDPRAHNLPPGAYAIEFQAIGTDGEPVTILPMVTGRVTGAILAGEPSIRMGSRIFPVADILEVRLADGTTPASPPVRTGAGQFVARPAAPVPLSFRSAP